VSRGAPIAELLPPVWVAEAEPGDRAGVAVAEFQAWRRQVLRAERLGDDLARKRARAALGPARAAATEALVRPRLRRAWASIEYTEECLVRERAGGGDGHHDPTLCYLCDPAATLRLTLPLAVGYATAAMFQVENGERADAELFADWNELRRGRGVRAVEPAALAHSPEARDDLRAFLAWELDDICLDYPVAHVRRWQGVALGRAEVDRVVARVLGEAERYWLSGKTLANGFNSTRL
jgi:hypothetical protein